MGCNTDSATKTADTVSKVEKKIPEKQEKTKNQKQGKVHVGTHDDAGH